MKILRLIDELVYHDSAEKEASLKINSLSSITQAKNLIGRTHLIK